MGMSGLVSWSGGTVFASQLLGSVSVAWWSHRGWRCGGKRGRSIDAELVERVGRNGWVVTNKKRLEVGGEKE